MWNIDDECNFSKRKAGDIVGDEEVDVDASTYEAETTNLKQKCTENEAEKVSKKDGDVLLLEYNEEITFEG